MDRDELAARIDHTVLGPTTTAGDVDRAVGEALEYGTNVCVPPSFVERSAELTEGTDTTLVTVIGFPQGQHAIDAKVSEAICAWEDGAEELDMVPHLGRVRAGERDAIAGELEAVVEATPCPVKVIVETALCSDPQLRTLGELAAEAGASHLKTCSGFNGGRARVADVALLSDYLPVKASGGIADYGTAAAMLAAGAERIGASRGIGIVQDYVDEFDD